MKHTILTIITEIEPAKLPQLEQMLEQIRLNLLTNPLIPFPNIGLLHFAGFVISDNRVSPPLLIFENNFDGETSPYLSQLLTEAGSGLQQIYQCCKGCNSNSSPKEFRQYLEANIVKPNAYHIGNVGRKAKVIKENQELRLRLEDYLDALYIVDKPNITDALQLRKKIQAFVKSDLDPKFQDQLPPHQTFLEKFLPQLNQYLLIAVLGAIVLAAFISLICGVAHCQVPYTGLTIVAVLLAIVITLRYKEEHDPDVISAPTVSDIEILIKTENMITQNHLANITDIKPGLFRLILLKMVLWGANILARTSTKGKLSGIPSIHFAHWSIINHNKHLLFLSNFDGSWASYLDDFIDKAAKGLTGIWSNTQGFPKTRFLVYDGARDEINFKAYARNHQVRSRVWYSAYRNLTVQNIDKDSRIRENLFSNLSEAETKEWLKLF
jgi:hypothetical protein